MQEPAGAARTNLSYAAHASCSELLDACSTSSREGTLVRRNCRHRAPRDLMGSLSLSASISLKPCSTQPVTRPTPRTSISDCGILIAQERGCSKAALELHPGQYGAQTSHHHSGCQPSVGRCRKWQISGASLAAWSKCGAFDSLP